MVFSMRCLNFAACEAAQLCCSNGERIGCYRQTLIEFGRRRHKAPLTTVHSFLNYAIFRCIIIPILLRNKCNGILF